MSKLIVFDETSNQVTVLTGLLVIYYIDDKYCKASLSFTRWTACGEMSVTRVPVIDQSQAVADVL